MGKKKLWRLLCTTGRTEKKMFGSPPAASLDEPRMSIPGPALIFRCQKMCSVFLWAAQGCQSQKSPKAWAVFEPSRNDSFIIWPLSSKEWFFNPRSSYGSKSNRHFTQKSDLVFEPFWPGSTNLIWPISTTSHYYFWLYLHLSRKKSRCWSIGLGPSKRTHHRPRF